jgi:hypothetical protein
MQLTIRSMFRIKFDEIQRILLLHPVVHRAQVNDNILRGQHAFLSVILVCRRGRGRGNASPRYHPGSIRDTLRRDVLTTEFTVVPAEDLVIDHSVQVPPADAIKYCTRWCEFLQAVEVSLSVLARAWNGGAYRTLAPLDGGHDVIRQVHVLFRFIHLFRNLHMRISCKQGIDDHILDRLSYPVHAS